MRTHHVFAITYDLADRDGSAEVTQLHLEGESLRGLVRVTQAVLARNPSNRAIPACRACRSASLVETPRKLTR